MPWPFSSEQGILNGITRQVEVPSVEWILITRSPPCPTLISSLLNAIIYIAPNLTVSWVSNQTPTSIHPIIVRLLLLSDCLAFALPRHHRGQVWADLLCGWHHDQEDWSEWDHLNSVGFQWLDLCSASQLWLCHGHFSGKMMVWLGFYKIEACAFTVSACLCLPVFDKGGRAQGELHLYIVYGMKMSGWKRKIL